MKIFHVKTSDIIVGAARAAHGVHRARQNAGADSSVIGLRSRAGQNLLSLRTSLDWLPLLTFSHRQEEPFQPIWFSFSEAAKLVDSLPAKVFHLHWIADGPVRVEQLPRSNRPTVWSSHGIAFRGWHDFRKLFLRDEGSSLGGREQIDVSGKKKRPDVFDLLKERVRLKDSWGKVTAQLRHPGFPKEVRSESARRLFLYWHGVLRSVDSAICTTGNHTKDHVHLRNFSRKKATALLSRAKMEPERKPQIKVNLFAWPFRQFGVREMSICRKLGVQGTITMWETHVRKGYQCQRLALLGFCVKIQSREWQSPDYALEFHAV